MRRAFLPLLASVTLLPLQAAAETPTTTRIETRPFYGATVTLEEGVRVFRPLPPHGRVIINPGGATPLNLNYEEHRSVSHSYTHEQAAGRQADGDASRGTAAYLGDGPEWAGGRHGSRYHGQVGRGVNGSGRPSYGGRSGNVR
ncbi:MAG: hypothetical protein SFW09_21905 [Hyphomicrobiaceae bacterium]|nr:hypothetical protein [Hyphomicrobiaceae bacterium]